MPDKVPEDLGRAAVARVLEGVTKTQAAAGMIPGGREAEVYAREIAEQTVKRHEEREARQGIDDLRGASIEEPKVIGPDPDSPSALERWDVPDDATVILDRPVGESSSLAAREHMHGPAPLPLHDQLMKIRLDFLMQHPDWAPRLHRAWELGEQEMMLSGSDLDRNDVLRRHKASARRVLEVLDASSTTFGDWRNPPRIGNQVIVPVWQAATVAKALSGE